MSKGSSGSPWITLEECAAYIRRSTGYLYRLASSGKIPAHQPDGKYLFHREEVDAWVRGHEVKPAAPAPLTRFQEAKLRLGVGEKAAS